MKIFFSLIFLFYIVNVKSQTFNVTSDGDTVNIIDANNLKQGQWVILGIDIKKAGYKRDQLVESGIYKDDKKNGKWIEYYENGNIRSEVTYLNGEPNGYAKLYYDSGTPSEEGIWQNYHWVGNYRAYYENGNLRYYFHINKKGQRTQGQIYFYEDGTERMEGEWENGQENGTVTEYYENGDKKSERIFTPGGKIDEEKSKVFQKTGKKRKKPQQGQQIIMKF